MIISKMKSYCSRFISTFSIFDKVIRNNIVWLVTVILNHGVEEKSCLAYGGLFELVFLWYQFHQLTNMPGDIMQ